jgi:hypothetical protein
MESSSKTLSTGRIRDGDGVINDGSEMFGNATPQPQPPAGTLRNGFLALAQYDDDGNGAIDEGDVIFSELRLWQDADHDGASQPAELHALPELGVAGIGGGCGGGMKVEVRFLREWTVPGLACMNAKSVVTSISGM